jgi:hypothetical protein
MPQEGFFMPSNGEWTQCYASSDDAAFLVTADFGLA